MVSTINSGGYQAYSYQAATTPVQESPRGGDNRIEARNAPAGDSQRGGSRETASRDAPVSASPRPSNDDSRGSVLDVTV